MNPAGAAERAQGFQRATLELVTERVEPIDQGWVVRDPSLPLVWSANHVRIARAVTFAEALALAEAAARRPPVPAADDRARADRRASSSGRSREAKWEVDREVLMELVGEPDREADLGIVIEADEEPVMGLMRRWIGEDETIELTPDGLDQVVEFTRREARRRNARLLGVRGEHGTLAGDHDAVLGRDGRAGRGRLHGAGGAGPRVRPGARDARRPAGARAGHEFVFIVADADDWPQRLYRKVGFEPIGLSWALHRGG